MISTHSKSKHFNPANLDDDLPCDRGFDRDEVGLVWAIGVKVGVNCFPHFSTDTAHDQARSFAKCKQLFADLQKREGVKVVHQLLIDMPVCWSSTYVMTS